MVRTIAAVGVLFTALLSAGAAPPAAATEEKDATRFLVVLSEGAVERLGAPGDEGLLELGHELGAADRIFVGNGSAVSVVAVDGPDAGRIVSLKGPLEGPLPDLLRAAAGSGKAVLAGADVETLRTPRPEVLEGPGVTRGATKGPLRPVYPAGTVAAPCGRFVFVSGIQDLSGGRLEIRLYDADPAQGAAPIATATAAGSPADVTSKLAGLAPKKKYWWKVVALLDSGEEALAGEPAEFTLVASPVRGGFPPGGFEKPEARASWHLARFRAFREKQLYLDAVCELDALNAAGGGSTVVEKDRQQIAKKLGLDEADLGALDDLASAGGVTADRVKLTDGRELAGRLVDERADAITFMFEGVSYRIERDQVAELQKGTGAEVMSAAPWVTQTSRRYVVSTNAGKEFAIEATRHLEATFDAFARQFGEELGARNARNLKVKVFRDNADFLFHTRKDHPDIVDRVAGFYAPKDSTLYLFRSFKEGVETTWPTLYHEASHQILHIVCNQDGDTTNLPGYWVLEALPSYMESLRWNGKVLEPGDPAADRTANFARLHREGRLVATGPFVELSQDGFRSADLYDQGHALFWYLLTTDDGKLRPALMKCVKISLQNRSREHAFRKNFGRSAEEVARGYEEWFLRRAEKN